MPADGNGPQPPFATERDLPRSAIMWALVCGLALMAAIAIGTAVTVNKFRENAIENGKEGVESAVMLLARHFDQQFQDFLIPQSDIVAELETHAIESADIFRSEMGTLAVHEQLRIRVNSWKDVAGANIFDSNGILINSSRTWPVPDLSIADRGYFQALRTDASLPLAAEVVSSRLAASSDAIVFARRISGPHGEFLGVITRAISSDALEMFFASVGLGEGATVSLLHRDGALLARHPRVESLIGRNFKSGPAQGQGVFQNTQLTTRFISPIDGKDRLVASRMLSSGPFVVVATRTLDSTLAAWRSQTKFFVNVAGLSFSVIVVTLYLIIRQMRLQHEAAQRRLTVEKRRLDKAINNMSQGLLLFDASMRLIVCNRKYIEMYGLSPQVIKPGCTLRDVMAHRKKKGYFSGDVDQHCRNVLNNLDKGGSKLLQTSDGRLIEIRNEPVPDGGWLATHEDVTERVRAQQRIAHLAYYDALTDLPNRVLFRQHVEQRLSHLGPGERFALLYVDVDEFKSVNDSLGHDVGDELLKSVAARLQECVGKADFVARLGGDEFAIVVVEVGQESGIVRLVERIYAAIRRPSKCLGQDVSADASIGIAIAPDHGTSLEELLKNADLAMYEAKANGRHTFRFFVPQLDARMKARRALEADLREALAQAGFEIHYQPVVDISTSAPRSCEALLRWCHPDRGMVSPAEFVPVAEEMGLIDELGEWVLRKACSDAVGWPEHINLAVNVSPLQFNSGTLALKVASALADSGLSPSRLELEITEAVLIRNDAEALSALHQLRALGIRIALDDFGTGYSSLSYIRRFPFDKLKIDRSFVTDVAESEGSLPIVKAVVQMASACGMTTTAEGVETERQREILCELGCKEMQGYLFSPAIPADSVKTLLSNKQDSAAA